MDSEPVNPFGHLSPERLAEFGRECDALHAEVYGDLGERDRRYIKSVIRLQRQLAVAGRVLLLNPRSKVLWAAGTSCLSLAKILENMEIGHNVLHGQWDWMNDPYIHSSTWDWDTASTAEAWKHSHNYIHHTFTNIRGKDKDLGYEIMRIDPHQRWHPAYLAQPLYNALLMAFFEWGVAVHDLDIEAIRAGKKPWKDVWHDLKGISGKARDQIVKDYLGWPLISALATAALGRVTNREPRSTLEILRDKARRRNGRGAVKAHAEATRDDFTAGFTAAFWANFTANIVRNVWAHSIIFCGHFPDQTYTFSQEETADESKGAWYARQMVGAANITGSPLFHLISGNLGYQVEHHLFPDMPSSRYAEIAPRVRDLCERYGLPYNTGPFSHQLGTVHRTIARLAFPGGKPRRKPGPYRSPENAGRPVAVGARS
jgi:fatty acid desaturase